VTPPQTDDLAARAGRISGVLHAALLTLLATYCLKAILFCIGAQHVDNLSWRIMSSIALPLVSADASPHNIVVLAIGTNISNASSAVLAFKSRRTRENHCERRCRAHSGTQAGRSD
jgi:hypothetical protein